MKQSIYGITLFDGSKVVYKREDDSYDEIGHFLYNVGELVAFTWQSNCQENIKKRFRIRVNNMIGWFYITGKELLEMYASVINADQDYIIEKRFGNKGSTRNIRFCIKGSGKSGYYETYEDGKENQ